MVSGMEPATVTLVGIGSALIVLGGLIAAVTGPLEIAQGSWLAAYLVLVCGVAQVVLGLAQEYLGGRRVSRSVAWAQVACWNLANAAVITGTVAATPVFVILGGLLLLPALAIGLITTRHTHRLALGWAFRGVIAILAVSIPIGMGLALVRNGG